MASKYFSILPNVSTSWSMANLLDRRGVRVALAVLGWVSLALGVVTLFVLGMSFALLRAIDLFSPLRVSQEQEALGLDLSQHDETVVPADLNLRMPGARSVPIAATFLVG